MSRPLCLLVQVSPQERQGGARGRREKRVLVTKRLDESPEGKPLKFAVIDNPVWLKEDEWCVRSVVLSIQERTCVNLCRH